MSICCVYLCDEKYLEFFKKSCNELIQNGKYNNDICLIVGDDLKDKINNDEFIIKNKIIIKYFPNINFTENFYNINNDIYIGDNRNINKKFQWHKLHLFNIFFKKWDFIFYIDCKMRIWNNIEPILECKKKEKLIAHSDSYPKYEWKLGGQFINNHHLYDKLNKNFSLDIDYFQTGILLYDTNIIKNNTFDELLNLSNEYPISRTNEQGIMNLYFNNKKNTIPILWEQIKLSNNETNYYDYCKRAKTNINKYIMTRV